MMLQKSVNNLLLILCILFLSKKSDNSFHSCLGSVWFCFFLDKMTLLYEFDYFVQKHNTN
jgi:hypothetical protein